MAGKLARSKKSGDRTEKLFSNPPVKTLKDDFEEVKKCLGLLGTEIKFLRVEIKELKQNLYREASL